MNPRTRDLLVVLAYLVAGATLVALYIHYGDRHADGYDLRLGSWSAPTPDYVVWTAFWMLLGAPAALLLALGFARLGASLLSRLRPPSDSVWMVGVATLAVAIPLGLRELVLGGAPLTDDEGAYEFMARLLASGRLYTDSPPLKEHFDIHFMVNNGKYYSQYFLGWPALMVPGVLVGIPKHIGALYSGALVVGLFLTVRRVVGVAWARLATVVYLTSVLFMMGAASQLSHIPCAAVSVWFMLAVLRSRDESAPGGIHAAVAVLFVIAFFMRPMTAVGVDAPFLVYWAVGTARLSRRSRWWAWGSLSVVALVGAAAFLAVNYVQNGSPLRVAYQAYLDYSRQNHYAFSPYDAEHDPDLPSLHSTLGPMLATFAGTLYRANSGLFGWPSCLLPVVLAWGAPRTRIWWWGLGWYALTSVPAMGVGIDTFGPIKATEEALVILVLAMAGLAQLKDFLVRIAGLPRWASPELPMALGVALVVLNLVGYVPPRLAAVARVASAVTLSERMLAAKGVRRALVFVRERVPQCASVPTRHFVLQRPYNTPGFVDPILWVNRLDPRRDAALRVRYSDRPAYVIEWNHCTPSLVPFEQASLREVSAPSALSP
ncbi:MAG: hypothetical protein JW940_24145 [Polyangiaceae bacterium]|nr:hypothetical protein [Polyangiaceae bacterium]